MVVLCRRAYPVPAVLAGDPTNISIVEDADRSSRALIKALGVERYVRRSAAPLAARSPPASQTAIKRTTLETSRHAVQPIQEKAWLAILSDLLPTDEELKKHNQDLSRTSIIKMVRDVIVPPPLTALSA